MKPVVEPEKLKPLFYWAGLTLHACQQLEYGIKALMVAMAEAGITGFDLNESIAVIENERKKTLGQALRMLSDRVEIDPELGARLDEAVAVRNRFIHGFLPDAADRIADPTTRDEVVSEIKMMRAAVLEGDLALKHIIGAFYAATGRDWDQMTAGWTERVRAMNDPA